MDQFSLKQSQVRAESQYKPDSYHFQAKRKLAASLLLITPLACKKFKQKCCHVLIKAKHKISLKCNTRTHTAFYLVEAFTIH